MKYPVITTINLSGVLDTINSDDIFKEIYEVSEDNTDIIIVDCQDLIIIDHTLLKHFIIASKRLRYSGVKMILCSISHQMKILLKTTNLYNFFSIFNNQDECKKTLGLKYKNSL